MDAIPSPAVYQVGDIVEIAGEADPNGEFQKSFSLAKVNAIGPDGALHVEYLEFLTEDGQKLRDTQPGDSPHVRPALPRRLYHDVLTAYKIGESVDFYEEDIWWQCVVVKVTPLEVKVSRELDGRMMLCGSPANLRLGYLWENQPGVWRRRVPVRTTVSRLRIMRKDQLETLLNNLTCEPPLIRDGRVAILLYQQEQQERARRAAEEAEAARLRKIQEEEEERKLLGADSDDEPRQDDDDDDEYQGESSDDEPKKKTGRRGTNKRQSGRSERSSRRARSEDEDEDDEPVERRPRSARATGRSERGAAARGGSPTPPAQNQLPGVVAVGPGQPAPQMGAQAMAAQQAAMNQYNQLIAVQAQLSQQLQQLRIMQQQQLTQAQAHLQQQVQQAQQQGHPNPAQLQQAAQMQLSQIQQAQAGQQQQYLIRLQQLQSQIQAARQAVQSAGGVVPQPREMGGSGRGRGRGRGRGGGRGKRKKGWDSEDDDFDTASSSTATSTEEDTEEEEEVEEKEDKKKKSGRGRKQEDSDDDRGLATDRSRRATNNKLLDNLKASSAPPSNRDSEEPEGRGRSRASSGGGGDDDGERSTEEEDERVWNPHYAARKAHNEAMRSEAGQRDAIRAMFLKTHLEKLKPFVTPEVIESIEERAKQAPHDYVIPEPITEQPASIRGEMREYQIAGLQWLIKQYDHGINAILADEMGLGKTLQTIAFLAHLTFDRKVQGPHLVVVPLSVLPNWMSEFRKFCPDLRVVRIHVNDEGERQRLRRDVLSNPGCFDVAVTTYDMVNSVHFGDALKHTLMWRYVILDEGHRVKNEDALISQGMRQIAKQHVLMLTGTPVQNNLHELFALLNFMFPDVFTDSDVFDKAFNLSQNVVDQGKLEAAHYLLRPFMLRRVKDEVECKLPPKVETRINCPLSEFQTFWYRRLLLRDSDLLKQVEAEGAARGMPGASSQHDLAGQDDDGDGEPRKNNKKKGYSTKEEGALPFVQSGGGPVSHWNKMMNLLMQLRKVCNHPYLFNIDAEPNFDGVTTGEDIVEASGKMQVLDRLLVKLSQKGHRVVLFSQFSRMLDILEDYIHLRGWRYKRLDGSTNRIQRMIDIQQFNRPGSDIFLYILCTRAGGLGVNLQTADTCILFDSDWNPQQDLQAMARVHRIGQNKPVHVYRLVSEGTVEERIQKRAEGKLYLDQMVNRGSTHGAEEMEKMSKHEVLNMLKYGADRIFKNDAGRLPTDAELEKIIDRSSMMAQTTPPPAVAGADNGIKAEDGPSAAAPADGEVKAEDGVKAEVKQEGGEAKPAAGGDGIFTTGKHSALDFNADTPAVNTFEFGGLDYKDLKQQAQNQGIKEMAADFWETWRQKREQEQQAKLQSGEITPQDAEAIEAEKKDKQLKAMVAAYTREQHMSRRRRRQTAGEDYAHCEFCQHCWDGGDLLLCDFCPVAVHAKCVGLDADEVKDLRKWGCPHHSCVTCGRNTAAAGGLLFRCEVCTNAYCEDHLPADNVEITGECEHFQALGQTHPKQACFILCSPACTQNKKELTEQLDTMSNKHLKMRQERLEKEAIEAARKAAEEAAARAAAEKAQVPTGEPGKRTRTAVSQRTREAQEWQAIMAREARPKAAKKSKDAGYGLPNIGKTKRRRGEPPDDGTGDGGMHHHHHQQHHHHHAQAQPAMRSGPTPGGMMLAGQGGAGAQGHMGQGGMGGPGAMNGGQPGAPGGMNQAQQQLLMLAMQLLRVAQGLAQQGHQQGAMHVQGLTQIMQLVSSGQLPPAAAQQMLIGIAQQQQALTQGAGGQVPPQQQQQQH